VINASFATSSAVVFIIFVYIKLHLRQKFRQVTIFCLNICVNRFQNQNKLNKTKCLLPSVLYSCHLPWFNTFSDELKYIYIKISPIHIIVVLKLLNVSKSFGLWIRLGLVRVDLVKFSRNSHNITQINQNPCYVFETRYIYVRLVCPGMESLWTLELNPWNSNKKKSDWPVQPVLYSFNLESN